MFSTETCSALGCKFPVSLGNSLSILTLSLSLPCPSYLFHPFVFSLLPDPFESI
eukprot:m.41909 g.41909  ORF g.41909 m.41909 type:complete len:54 (+) comp10576_c0_seq3:670-831(+)